MVITSDSQMMVGRAVKFHVLVLPLSANFDNLYALLICNHRVNTFQTYCENLQGLVYKVLKTNLKKLPHLFY